MCIGRLYEAETIICMNARSNYKTKIVYLEGCKRKRKNLIIISKNILFCWDESHRTNNVTSQENTASNLKSNLRAHLREDS